MNKYSVMGFINKVLARPLVWNLSQFVFGGNSYKQQLYRSLLTSPGKLLDFGCADGNTFPAFKDFDYYGVDIDRKFTDYARHKYKDYPNAHWITADILSNPFEPATFDYVLFAETGHHISDEMLYPIMQSLINVIKKKGKIFLVDHVGNPSKDNWWIKLLIKFDQGQFARTEAAYMDIINKFSGQVKVVSSSIRKARGNFFPLPDFYIVVLEKL